MNKQEISNLEKIGFNGKATVKELMASCKCVPESKGLYVVMSRESSEMPEFLAKGTGGKHKGADLNYPVEQLESQWVEGTSIIYIGKTDNSLRKRIRTYMRFGMGIDAPHRGGRSIWQLPDAEDLEIMWWPLPADADARKQESDLLNEFVRVHGCLPFANMVR